MKIKEEDLTGKRYTKPEHDAVTDTVTDNVTDNAAPNGKDESSDDAPRVISFELWECPDPAKIPPRDWLYGKKLIRRFVSVTVARGGIGKTSKKLVEADAMAIGRPLLGVFTRHPLKVAYWNGEDPREEIDRRLAAIMIKYGIKREEIVGQLFVAVGDELPICIAVKERDRTVFTPDCEALEAALKECRADVFIADPFISAHDVPENDNTALDKVTKKFGAIGRAAGCAMDLQHHIRKPGGGSNSSATVDDGRGGGAMHDAARVMNVLNKMTIEEAKHAGIEAEERRLYFRADNGKGNMSSPEKAEWFKLESVCLNNGPSPDWVQVVVKWEYPGVFCGRDMMDDWEKAKEALAGGVHAANSRSKLWAGIAIGDALGIDSDGTFGKEKIRDMINAWVKGGRLVKANGRNLKERKPLQVLRVVKE